MSDRLAAVALRLLAPRTTGGVDTADGDDLANLDTTNLPDHSLCWAADTLFELDRSSAAAASNYTDGQALVVVPNSGPGAWLAKFGEGLERLSFNFDATQFNGIILSTGADEWTAYPSISVDLTGSPTIADVWTFTTPSSAILTYNGPTKKFSFRHYICTDNDTGANADGIELGLSVNGANIGTTTTLTSVGSISNGADQLTRQINHEAIFALGSGATVQPMFRSVNGDDYVIRRWHMSVQPVAD